jgi:hypothetical protein
MPGNNFIVLQYKANDYYTLLEVHYMKYLVDARFKVQWNLYKAELE